MTEPAPSRHAWLTLAVSSLAVLAAFLDTTVLFVAFPAINRAFSDVSRVELSWVLNGYTIVFAALLIPAGKAADRLGHKRAFLVGSALFTVGSMACGLAPSAELLILFRLVQAAGGAILLPASLALVLRAFPPEKVPVAVAVWGATGAVAGALGPTLGAAVVESAGWRWVFFLNLPIGVFTIVAGRRILRESTDPTSKLPAPLGVVLVAASAAALSYGVVQSGTWGWLDARTLGMLGAGVLLLGAFVLDQRRTAAPVLDLELFRIGNFAWGNGATVAFSLGFTAMFFGSILFLTNVWHWSILKAGFGVAPGPLLVAVLAPRLGSLAGRIGQRPLLVAGGVAFAAGGLWRYVMLGASPDYVVDYLPSMALTGLGVALSLPQLSSVVAQSLPPNRLGVGGAVNQAIRQLGGTFGVALTVAFLGQPSGPADALARFDRVWLLIVAGGLVTSLLVLPLRTRRGAVVAPSVDVAPMPAAAAAAGTVHS